MRRAKGSDPRQPGLVLVAPGTGPVTDAERGRLAREVRIGPAGEQMWLDWRINRQQYCVGYYDRAARTGRRVGLRIGPGPTAHPPREAHEALAAVYAARARPAAPQPAAAVGVSTVLTRYLTEHCVPGGVHAPERQAYAVLAIERFIDHRRRDGHQTSMLTVDDIDRQWIGDYARFRRGEGVGDATIKRELGVLRAGVNLAVEDRLIASRPFIPKLVGEDRLKTRSRKLAYNMPQLAALLEAAWADPRRHHVHLFIVAMLGSHARTEAITECDLDLQYEDGVIDWLGPVEEQTKKRRSATPVGPTLAAWLEGRSGKLIRYRVEKSSRAAIARRVDPDVPEYFERATASIGTAFEKTLLVAGAAHPSLKLSRPLLDAGGSQVMRRVGRRQGNSFVFDEVPRFVGVGSPNTLRHSIHTQLRRIGVPKGQIDAASGHAEQGTGENYNHLDPKHDLKDFTAGVERLFDELRAYTTAHLRSHCGANVVDLGAARVARTS